MVHYQEGLGRSCTEDDVGEVEVEFPLVRPHHLRRALRVPRPPAPPAVAEACLALQELLALMDEALITGICFRDPLKTGGVRRVR